MPVNKHALIRYHALDKCFSNFAKRYYIEDLIAACNEALYNFTGNERYGDPLSPGISRRQVLVDIDFMESPEGWSAMVERVKDGRRVYYRYEDRDYSINNQPITDEELTQLRETMLMLSRFKGLPQLEWMDALLTNLEDKFHLKGSDSHVISMDGNAYVAGIEYLAPLFNAIVNKTPLKIQYNTFDGRSFKWEIHPYHIKQYNNRWFLIGLNNDGYGNLTTLALDRINDVAILGNHYIPNALVEDFDEYFDDIIGVSFPAEKTLETVTLKFSKNRFPYVEAKPLHGSQKTLSAEEGLIELNLIPNKELEALILSFGDDVEVISPASLKESIAQKIANAYKKYASVQKGCTNNSYLCCAKGQDSQNQPLSETGKPILTDADSLHK